MKTKVRGLRRHCRKVVRAIEDATRVFPSAPDDGDVWHFHLPVQRALLESHAASFWVRRLCVQTLIDRANYLAYRAPTGQSTRVFVAVVFPELSASQIIVFFRGSEANFWNRNTSEQKWTPKAGRLSSSWGLRIPSNFAERGYDEEWQTEGETQHGQIWFFGELGER